MTDENKKESSQHLIEMNRWLIHGLDILSELTKTFQADLRDTEDLTQIYQVSEKALRKVLLDLNHVSFLGLEEDDINMELVYSMPKDHTETILNIIEEYTDNGTFGWALCENRLVIVPDKKRNKTILFHVLATHNQVLGMFVGITTLDIFVSDAAKKLISVILLDTAHSIESIALTKDLKASERMRQEVESAAKIQASLLPKDALDQDQLIALGHCLPSDQIGGDYYDFFSPSEELVNLAICDISGHGVPAGLFMTMVRSIIRTMGHSKSPPLKVIHYLNGFLGGEIPDPEIFVTGIYSQFHKPTKTLTYVTAGHPAPWLINHKGQTKRLPAKGLAMGIVPDIPYEEHQVVLKSGDTVLFFTDGLYELKKDDGIMLGEEGLELVIQKIDWTSPQKGVKQLFEEMNLLKQQDDQTVLVLKIK